MSSSARYFSCVNCYRRVPADYDVTHFTCREWAENIFKRRGSQYEDDDLDALGNVIASCSERSTLIDLIGRANFDDVVSRGINRSSDAQDT